MGTVWFENQSLEIGWRPPGLRQAFRRRQHEFGNAWQTGKAFPRSLLKPNHRSTADSLVEIIKEGTDLSLKKTNKQKNKSKT